MRQRNGFLPMSAPRFLVYQSYIGNDSWLTYSALRDQFGAKAIGFCTAAEILGGRLDGGVDLFVMPGGADLYYAEKLNGEGNRRIRAFVESGGRYLGICAGAYYACAHIDYAKGTPHEVTGSRELGFFSGRAIGPIGTHLVYNEKGLIPPEIFSITHTDAPDRESKAVYWGGPFFHAPDPDDGASWDVLARYPLPGAPPAIIRTRNKAGVAVLSGIHPEIRAHDLDAMAYAHNGSKNTFSQAASALRADENAPDRLWNHVLRWTMDV